MSEVYLYQFVKSVLEQSVSIQGRFFVAEGYGSDLNNNNFENIIKDALSNIKIEKKYPLAVMMPPVDQEGKDPHWFDYKLKIFFVTLNGQGQNGIKNVDFSLNVSQTEVFEDWDQMRIAAGDFVTAFTEAVKYLGIINTLRPNQRSSPVYERYSKMNNDGCNGVSVDFDIQLSKDCNLVDYLLGYLALIDDPDNPDYCAILKASLTDEQKECLKVLIQNSDDSYNEEAFPGTTHELEDTTIDVYINGVFDQTADIPSMEDYTVNINL